MFRIFCAIIVFLSLVPMGCSDFGNNAHQDTNTPPFEDFPRDETPTWSPIGQTIAYIHISINPNDTTYPTGLYVIDTTGNNRRLVIAGSAYAPDWSPDGNRIAFQSGDIFSISQLGDNLVQITTGGQSHLPSWSPNGLLIAFDRSGTSDRAGIWVVNTETHLETRIGIGGNPDWSPDSRRLVHLRAVTGVFGEEIVVIDTTGQGLVRLTFNENNDRHPKWSPSGASIAWTSFRGSTSWVCLMDSNGANKRDLVEGAYPAWSPDSRQITFSGWSPTRDKAILWVINSDGTGLRQLTR